MATTLHYTKTGLLLRQGFWWVRYSNNNIGILFINAKAEKVSYLGSPIVDTSIELLERERKGELTILEYNPIPDAVLNFKPEA